MVPRAALAARLALCCAAAFVAGGTSVFAQDDRLHSGLDDLVAAYPDALSSHDATTLRWRDGTAMPISDGTDNKPLAQLLRHASIADQFRLPYPLGPLAGPPAIDNDPGRFRSTAFFTKMYGDCKRDEVSPHLVAVPWLPKTWLPKSSGQSLRVTTINGVAEQLRSVSAEIDALPDDIKRAAYPSAGTYKCRAVADTGEPSPHSYGIAIDLNTAFSDYWYWRPHNGAIRYRNRMPEAIVAIFEKHGFIWGGKWYHFDTMHFEYRPELLAKAQRIDNPK